MHCTCVKNTHMPTYPFEAFFKIQCVLELISFVARSDCHIRNRTSSLQHFNPMFVILLL
uniref:Uncharacterized protein n=1 Tax=Anguilla anguilla TaxID=7936 RepID=A0A0E9QZK8_ANGAN